MHKILIDVKNIESDPVIIQDHDGKRRYEDPAQASLVEITPLELMTDLPKKLFGWIPGVGQLFGNPDQPTAWDGDKFKAIYQFGMVSLRHLQDALDNEDPNFIYATERRGEWLHGLRFDLAKLRATNGQEGKEEFFKAHLFDPHLNGWLNHRTQWLLRDIKDGDVIIIPSKWMLKEQHEREMVYRGFDDYGNTIWAADVHPTIGKIVNKYYTEIPRTIPQELLARHGMTTETKGEKLKTLVNPSGVYYREVGPDGKVSSVHPSVLFSRASAVQSYFMAFETNNEEKAHVVGFNNAGEYVRSERLRTLNGLRIEQYRGDVVEKQLLPRILTLKGYDQSTPAKEYTRKIILPRGMPVVTDKNTFMNPEEIGILVDKRGPLASAVADFPDHSEFLFSQHDINGLVTLDQEPWMRIKENWTKADGTKVAEFEWPLEAGKAPPVLIVAGKGIDPKKKNSAASVTASIMKIFMLS